MIDTAQAPETTRIRFGLTLREAAMRPTRREVEVVCIRPGLSRNGNFYGPECLQAALPLFEGARCYIDHSEAGVRSVRDLAGIYRAARSAEWLWEMIRECVEDGTDLVGLSIDVSAAVRDGEVAGRRARIVERITALHSVDVITRASAGGGFEKILEADNQSWWDQAEPDNEEAAGLARRAAASSVPITQQQWPVEAGQVAPVQFGPSAAQRIAGGQIQLGGSYVVLENRETLNMPAMTMEAPAGGAPILEQQIGAGQSPVDEAARLLEELRRERTALEGERVLDRVLRESGLPLPAARRLEDRLRGQALSESAIRQAVEDERAFLAELAGAGLIRGMGFEKSARVTMTEGERLQKAFDQLFDLQEGEPAPRLSGIREAYVAATRDVEVSGATDPARLREADTTTASFSYLLGTSMNKRLLKDYQAWPSEWQKFCTITPIKDFKQQDRIRLGAFGSLTTVAEDTAYSTITLADTKASYTPAKRGNLVAVTRETIVNDDLYAIKQIPGKLAVAAAFTLAEFVYGLLAANGAVIYDTFKLFDSINHLNTGIVTANLGAPGSGAGLSSGALQTAVTKMRRQTNLAAKPIGLKPRYLVVAPELEFTAMVITKSAGAPGSNFNDINPVMGYAEVVVAPQIASPTYWMAVTDPRVIDTLEIGFVGGQMNPQLFIQDQPLFGNNFTNDVITYKVRHEYGGAVVDYRGFYLGNN
ncbi:MAG TPA: Mu-like prophage major head subunit gpT family protein [Chloroflexota bacterium]|nr:Mu-like prophage major head subunit gpT family protein [Chloroflexota bacterium]